MTDVVVEPTEVLEPSAQNLVVVLAKDTEEEYVLVQKPLTFFGKMEFFAVMGKAIEKALADGSTISELLDVPDRGDGKLSTDDLKDADVFVKAIAKLIQYAPELMGDLYCVVLGIPRGEREYAKFRLENELTDDQGFDILNTFIDQNWEVMIDFFSEKILPLFKKVTEKVQESTSSKSSKPTPQSTRKQSKSS